MAKMQPVILCGNSIFMSGLALTLERQGGFPVRRAANPEEAGQLPQTIPAAILVDCTVGQQWFESLVDRYPDALIITLSPDKSTVKVYSRGQVSSINDLVEIIKKHLPPADCNDITGSGR